MPRLAHWDQLPRRVREHLIERMHDRAISLEDLSRLRGWTETNPEVPDGDWFHDFGTFRLCGRGEQPKTFLLPGQAAKGQKL